VLLARHLEAYAEERDIALNSFGNTTYRKRAKQAGLEPDVAYYIGDIGTVPHIALEVVFTSGGIDKLEIYRRLGVREVWFWIDEALMIYVLGTAGYAKHRASKLIPDLDISDLSRRVLTAIPASRPRRSARTAKRYPLGSGTSRYRRRRRIGTCAYRSSVGFRPLSAVRRSQW
jgi:hypothetical protein